MDISKILRKNLLLESDDYRGEHSAPTKVTGSPMSDLSEVYGDDIYGPNAFKYFGQGQDINHQCLSIIQGCRNNPNKSVAVYRAVPDVNKELKLKIEPLVYTYNYLEKYSFLPKGSEYSDIFNKFYHEDRANSKQKMLDIINLEIDEVNKEKVGDLTINPGDWVSINLSYAKDHGKSHLKNSYKIIKKTVKASQLFTDGNDLAEWGYDI